MALGARCLSFAGVLCLSLVSFAGEWRAVGPFGGDARSLTADPHHFTRLFLGTSNSQVYTSTDGGANWSYLSQVAPRHDLVVTRILIEPNDANVLYAATWSTGSGGGVFRSRNGGITWKSIPSLEGQSVRALAMAPTDSNILVAGTLEGVFQSNNAGESWRRISPLDHAEIRNVESLAIDRADPAVIYAGTWHLPWKTVDSGQMWFSVKSGIIDDSDVFSVTVDWSNRETLYLGACSGIYRSDSAGRQWRKIQGLPDSARRTRVIRQDPRQSSVVYAGTTEGLWKTATGGTSWDLMTSRTLIVNEVLIDPADPSHLLLATDRAGVLESRNAGKDFAAVNNGFSHRLVWRLSESDGQLVAAVHHDKEYGGVFASSDGTAWRQWSAGLGGRDILALARMPGGEWLAGAADGLFRLAPSREIWSRAGRLAGPIHDLVAAAGQVYAATDRGLWRSKDAGETWQAISPKWRVDRVTVSDSLILAATLEGIQMSTIDTDRWELAVLPESPAAVSALVVAGKTIYAATDRGLFRSPDLGATWERHGRGVPLGPVSDVLVDPADPKRIYVASPLTSSVYASTDGGRSYEAIEEGRQPRRLAMSGGKLYFASGYDGVFVRK